MPEDPSTPAPDPYSSADLTWDGTFPDHGPPQETPRSHRAWLRAVGILAAVIVAAGAGFVGGIHMRGTAQQDRPTVVEPGTPTGFDTRRPGWDADGTEVPFINIRYYAFEMTAATSGFDGRCLQDVLLFVVGRFTPCSWALSVIDRFRGYNEHTYLGYEPSFVLDGVDVYCHYQNPGILFYKGKPTRGIPAWECRADGGKQLVFTGLTMTLMPPEECWAADGTLRANMSIFAGSPADKERPTTKPGWPTPIEDCAP